MDTTLRHNLLKQSSLYDERYYRFLSYLLAAYIIVLIFIGRFPNFQQLSIWLAGPIFAIIVVSNFIKRPVKVPREVLLFGLLWLWTFPGYLSVVDFEGYFRYFRLVFTILVLFFCIEIVIIKAGNIKLLYKVLIVNCILFFAYAIFQGDFFTATAQGEDVRLYALVNTSNGFAYIGLTGISGILFLWNEIKSFNQRLLYSFLLGSFIVMIVLTASRSGFITMLFLIAFWLMFCYYQNFKKHAAIYIVAIILLIPFLYSGYSYLLDETYLGERLNVTVEKEGGITTESRFLLYEQGFEMFKKNPLYGVGLSQFKYYAESKSIAHSEYMEILATTGLIGFVIMFFFYLTIFRKIKSIKKVIRSPHILYRLNLSYAILVSILIFGFFRANFLDILTMVQIAIVAGYTNYLAHKYKKYLVEKESYKEIKAGNLIP